MTRLLHLLRFWLEARRLGPVEVNPNSPWMQCRIAAVTPKPEETRP